MKLSRISLLAAGILFSSACMAGCKTADGHLPTEQPRTWILDGQQEDFRQFCQNGAGSVYIEKLKAEFDQTWMDWPFPAEPVSYGDPSAKKRTSDKVDKWRAMQDVCGQVTGVAEAATLFWILTGEEAYLTKAKEFLVAACRWDPLGPTGINYNDEAHFRLFRKLPGVYDQIRHELSDTEREQVLSHLRIRGNLNFASIKKNGVGELSRNSVEKSPKSHSVRFMASTGLAGLALYDDIPEAREWWSWTYDWYRDVFTPWGGDDGGWAEGPAYWRGVYEHAVFQDALLAIGDPLAYSDPFWKNTGYFQVYFVTAGSTTGFGDLSNAGQFNMEPGVKHFIEHLGKVTGNGYYLSYVENYEDPRPLPHELGIAKLYRSYPTAAECLVREFIASSQPLTKMQPMSELPGSRHFSGIGWVAMHSDLGNNDNDIMLFFKSSPYGSFSHSHADQNSFILNAFGAQLAINSGYREYHRSQMHKYYTRQTFSKNNILINRHGQEVQDKEATGKIARYVVNDRYVWTTGDATEAFNTRKVKANEIDKALRDIVFIDNRYFIIRDHVTMDDPGRIDWLLHARNPFTHDASRGRLSTTEKGVHLFAQVKAFNNGLAMESWTGFLVDADPKYKDPDFINSQVYLREPAVDQAHFQANTMNEREEQILFSVLWPSKDAGDGDKLSMRIIDSSTIEVVRPDGVVDRISLDDESLSLN